MKRWIGIVLGVLVAVAGLGVLFLFRAAKPSGDLSFLDPYVKQRKVEYGSATLAMVGQPLKAAQVENDNFVISGLSIEDCARMMNAHLPASKNWRIQEVKRNGHTWAIIASTGSMGSPDPTPSTMQVFSLAAGQLQIRKSQVLTPLQVWLIRAQHAGKDPFKP